MGAPSEGTAEEATPHLQGQERLFMEEGASPLSLQGVKQGKRLGTEFQEDPGEQKHEPRPSGPQTWRNSWAKKVRP
jgi:hypothetical protein